jgi:mono/diheme cytochrome c family protein
MKAADAGLTAYCGGSWAAVALSGLVGLAALSIPIGSRAARAADQIPPAAMKEAEEIYTGRCTMCHGPAGTGGGPAAAALNPKPRDLGDPAWQKSVTDEHIEKIILGGGPAVGKSPLMPANPDLGSKPDVIKALCVLVRNPAPSSSPTRGEAVPVTEPPEQPLCPTTDAEMRRP